MSKFSFYTAAIALVLFVGHPAQAATIQWDLDNVHGGQYTVTGSFDATTPTSGTTPIITNANITVSDAGGTVFSQTGVNGTAVPLDVIFASGGQGVEFFLATALLDSVGAVNLGGLSAYFNFHNFRDSAFLTGELVGSAVPLPSGLPMLGVAMLALAGFSARRKLI